MSGLVLNLKPYEKVLVGGVVLQNGQRRGQLRVLDEKARVLRLAEALHPDEARTPLTRAYYVAQTIVSGDAEEAQAAPVLERLLEEASAAFGSLSLGAEVEKAACAASAGNHCRVMRLLRPLLAQEAAIMTRNRCAAARSEGAAAAE